MKGDIPGFPPLASPGDLERLLTDIYTGKLSVIEARQARESPGNKKSP